MGKIGQTIIDLEEVDSTNFYAERLLLQGTVEEGTVIRAGFQTTGKGQGDNTWESEPGRNLTFTAVLHPRFLSPDRQFLINQAIALGVVDFLSHYADAVAVKWPNDILAGAGKIAGILIQHIVAGEELDTTIAGIGININQRNFGRYSPQAVSLVQILHLELDLREALDLLCLNLNERYSQLRSNAVRQLEKDYYRVLLGMDEERIFTVAGKSFRGFIRGVDVFGRLLVEHPGMPVKAYAHREVELSI